jgi:signal transduction histidine kinase
LTQSMDDLRDELRALKSEAEAATKARSNFLTRLFHEFYQPLSVIIGFSERILREPFGPIGNEYRTYVEDIKFSANYLHDISKDILDIGQHEAGKMELREEAVDIEVCVQDALRLIAPQAAQGNVTIRWLPGTTALPQLYCDPLRLRQILLNVLGNAVKFTKPGGQVEIAVEFAEDGPTFVIRDTGVGIRLEDLSRILKPFERSSSASKVPGAGLGLALTNALMERHGGSVTLSSILDVGTTVRLSFSPERVLPGAETCACDEDGGARSNRGPGLASDLPRRRRILIVEDKPLNMKLVRDLLDGQGYETLAAVDGREAIRLAQETLPDLILMDIGLPDISGLEAARLLRSDERTSRIPIIAVTAFSMEGDQRKALDAGCDGYIAKPIRVHDFLQTIAEAGKGGDVPRQPAADDFEAIRARVRELRRECDEAEAAEKTPQTEIRFAEVQMIQAFALLVKRVSNALNNRLTAIIGFSDLLLERLQPHDLTFADVLQINQNAKQSANLLRELSSVIAAYRDGAPVRVRDMGRLAEEDRSNA